MLTVGQVQAILDGCVHLRDRLLFALLLDTGVRIGEALGLRHEDVEIADRHVTVVPRDNDNRARVKGGRSRTIPASPQLMRLYADYLNREYGALDSDYVFVNLWAEPRGHPLAYPAVYDLVGRLRRRTGVVFGPHHFRHTYATWLLRRGRRDGECEGVARPRLDHHHDRHLRPSDRRGRPRDFGGRGLVHRAGGAAVSSLFEITHADRVRWQRRAAAMLATILNEHTDLPLIAWLVGTAGASLVGRVDGLRTAQQVRAEFELWCAALQVGERAETPTSAGAHLRATVHTGGVKISLTAAVRDEDEPTGCRR